MTASEFIDLRSDTVTTPTADMRAAMAQARVGDDVFGDDPTVNLLEAHAAKLLGHEAGLFVSSGTLGNLLAILTHCQRGEEYIAGNRAHCYLEEAGGGAVLASVQPQPLTNLEDGTLDLAEVAAAIKPDDFHFAVTRLLCLENTFWGKSLPLDYLARGRKLAVKHGLRYHLDGARIFNAAVHQQVAAREIAEQFDSVSVCLSKGLGAPVGTVLIGREDFINRARRWRKMLGGGTRQAGILAAAGLHALDHHIERLADDHAHAALLAELLEGIDEITVLAEEQRTNMVFASVPDADRTPLGNYLQEQGIRVLADDDPVRLVTHLGVSEADIRHTASTIKRYFSRPQNA